MSSEYLCMKFQVHTAVKISIIVFWVVMSCGLVDGYQRLGGTYPLHLQGELYIPPKH